MRSKSDKKKPLVPSLRFPEFREAGAWEVKRLGGIGSVSMCKRILKSQTSESGDIPFYKIGTFSKQADAFIENKIYEEFKEKYSFPNKGDILISASGTIGRTVVYDGKPAYFQDSNIVWIANNENILLNAFLYYCYKTIQWQTDDNTISRLYNDNLRKMKIVVPPIPEQQKIAHCLSSLDEVIGLQAKKVQALKQHKKGLMQQLFPAEGETTPRLRFPEFREAGAWEVKELSAALAYAQPTPFIVSTEQYGTSGTPVLTAGKTFILGHTSEDFGIYERVPVIIFDDFTTEAKFVDFPFKVKSSAIKILSPRPGYSLKFVLEAIISIQFDASQHKRHWIGEFQHLKIPFPPPKEQQKIAHCLSSLDEVIGLDSHKLDALKNLKKGLMQQLFPQEVA